MKHKLLVLIASTCTLGIGAGTALASSPGAGQAQLIGQHAATFQKADADAFAKQNAVNANVAVSIAGGNVFGGPSSANQTASNTANAVASNKSLTGQLAVAKQTGGTSSCHVGCGGSGQFQAIGQKSTTKQKADADADAKQNAVNANVPVSIAGGNVFGGPSSANQTATNAANSNASNKSATLQLAKADQQGGSSSCKLGCGGSGQFQAIKQSADTKQKADADADAKQNAVNANVPVSIAGGDVFGGPSSANQTASNSADADASNKSLTGQLAFASQTGGTSSCLVGCGGSGQFQAIGQHASTEQKADADADAKQNAVNTNAPVAVAGGDVFGGSSSANQTATNSATGNASNKSATLQVAVADQRGGGSSCKLGCGGLGQFQAVGQHASTHQWSDADADAKQNAVNGNAPVSIAGKNVFGGPSSANQTATNSADVNASNKSLTAQLAFASQSGSGCERACSSGCKLGCSGSGQFQAIWQAADTKQKADADADAKQNAVNGNAPVSIAGKNVFGGPSSANQTATNSGTADSRNWGFTLQLAKALQA